MPGPNQQIESVDYRVNVKESVKLKDSSWKAEQEKVRSAESHFQFRLEDMVKKQWRGEWPSLTPFEEALKSATAYSELMDKHPRSSFLDKVKLGSLDPESSKSRQEFLTKHKNRLIHCEWQLHYEKAKQARYAFFQDRQDAAKFKGWKNALENLHGFSAKQDQELMKDNLEKTVELQKDYDDAKQEFQKRHSSSWIKKLSVCCHWFGDKAEDLDVAVAPAYQRMT